MRFSAAGHAPPQTLACELRDYPEWHRGRTRYAVWMLSVECPQILARLQRAQQHLGDWLHQGYRRQAHITLFVCGFPVEQARFEDDFPLERLAAQQQAVLELGIAPFELHIGGLDSFASAPFLTVNDPNQHLVALRAALGKHSAEIRQSPYHAHLTVGLYARALPCAQISQSLAAFADRDPLPLTVEALHYSTYAAEELFGPLCMERRLALPGQ